MATTGPESTADARSIALIDLDLAPWAQDGEDRPRRPARAGAPTWRAASPWCCCRRPAPPPSLIEVALWDMGSDISFMVNGEWLFVSSPDGGMPGGRAASAYELPSGRFLRTASQQRSGRHFSARPVGDVVLLAGSAPDGNWESTTALDAATGARRWTRPGLVVAAGDGRTGLTWPPEGPGLDPRTLETAVLDLASGTTLWSIPGMAGLPLFRRGVGSQLLLLSPQGAIEVRDLRTPYRVSDCEVGTASAVCRAEDGRLGVWAYRR